MSRKIAYTGIFTGVVVILLYMSTIMPTGKLTLFFLASVPVALAIIEFGAGAGAAVYIAACILSALIAGNLYGIVPFVLFFGHYPIWKYYIEKGRTAALEVLMKLAVFNMSAFLWYLLFNALFMEVLPSGLKLNGIFLIGFIIVMQLVFFIYDYVLSRVLFYYEERLSGLKRR